MADPRVLVRSDRVREALEAAGLRSASAGPLRLEKAWPLRDGAIVGLYGGGATPAWRDRFAVAGRRSDAPPGLERRALEAGTLHALPRLDGLALRFPSDPWLPQLASVGTGQPRAHPISYKPMRRCSFELRADDASPPSRYLKCYRAGDLPRVRQVYDELEAARARGGLGLLEVTTRHQGAAGSELLAWDPVRGPCLTDLLLADEAEPVAMTVGAAVADLHASDVVWPLVHRPEDELEALARWVSIAARAFPAEARRLREVREAVAKRASRHSPGPVAPAHRDLAVIDERREQGIQFVEGVLDLKPDVVQRGG